MPNQSSLAGFPQVAQQGILDESETIQGTVGGYIETADGRGFRYSKIGAVATVPGKVYQSKALDATNDQPSGGHATAAVAAGSTTFVTTGTATVTANEFQGGYLAVVVTPGQGYTYRIKSHAAFSAAAVTMELDDPIIIALTTSSNAIWCAHPYNGIVIEPGTPTGKIVGVPPTIITAAYYGWTQTKGVVSVLFTGTGVAGAVVGSLVGGTSGSTAPAIAATNISGQHMATGISGEYSLIYLTID